MQARNTIEPLRPEAFLPAVIHCKMEGWRLVQLCATRLPEGYELSYSFAKELDLRTLRLVVKEEQKTAQVAERLSISYTNAATRIYRMRKKLKRQLSPARGKEDSHGKKAR